LNQEEGITVTTVGIGQDAAAFLPEIAQLGGGRYHFAADPGAIPSIFTEETMLATRSYIIEEAFNPKLLRNSPILDGVGSVPALYGYVGTSPKETAQTILVTHKDDPLLAAWQYGLGKVAAFTSDATNRWAKDWVAWPGFALFWANMVRYTIGETISPALNMQVQLDGEQATLTVDTAGSLQAGSSNLYLDGYSMQANLVNPQGRSQTITLAQVAPGKYEGSFTPVDEGVYLIHVTGEPPTSGGSPVAGTNGWVYAYSPEYRQLDADPDALYRVALAGNGKVASSDPADAFEHSLSAPGARRPLWKWLVFLAAVLLPLDIALRRLVINQSDLRKGWSWVGRKLQPLRPVPAALAPRSERIEGLMQVKSKRSSEEWKNAGAKPLVLPPKPEPGEKRAEISPTVPPAPSPGIEKEETPQSTAAVLLAKKRERK
jgi:hypothetical protein